MFEDVYEEKQDVERRLESMEIGPKERERLSARLRQLNSAVGEKRTSGTGEDPLVDKWLAELEAGITPDLDETL